MLNVSIDQNCASGRGRCRSATWHRAYKNYPAKQLGIKTGEAIWQAKQKCPKLVVLPPDFRKYLRFSRLARSIYSEYTDQIESFGIDEAWLDITGSLNLFGTGQIVADTIR